MTPLGVLHDARQTLAEKLAVEVAPPVVVTLNPAAVAPFVLVDVLTIDGPSGVGAWSATVPVVVAVPPPGDDVALTQLGELVEVVLRTLGPARAVPDLYTAPGGKELPAYTLTYRVDVSNPDC